MSLSLNKLVLINKLNDTRFLIIVKLTTPTFRFYSRSTKDYAKCFKTLEIPNDSDQETVRKAFLSLCKKYHPDSGTTSADALKFQEIESAYRSLQNKFADERWNVNEGIGEYGLYYKEKKDENAEAKPEVFDIKHTAPQHRQYLSFDGVGSGTPFQRQKQYVKYRTVMAIENVHDHHVKKITQGQTNAEHALVIKDKKEAKKIKTRYGIERVVEDLIQESMAQGHFDNLKGQGKPLPPSNYNPYVDFVTHKMNQILIDNGFTPEWIMLQKEIGDEIDMIRERLTAERTKLGPLPLNVFEDQKWRGIINNLTKTVEKLNQKINKFNLVVPVLEKQRLYFNLEKESCDILKTGRHSEGHMVREEKKKQVAERPMYSDFFSFFK